MHLLYTILSMDLIICLNSCQKFLDVMSLLKMAAITAWVQEIPMVTVAEENFSACLIRMDARVQQVTKDLTVCKVSALKGQRQQKYNYIIVKRDCAQLL